ncbi:MAG: hypothetical protein AAFV95_11545 [Bacteroidota bacterium]
MRNSKVVAIIDSFNKTDLTQFRKYLISPFFNEQEALVALFDLLCQYLQSSKNESGEELDKLFIWKQVFGSDPYNDLQLRRLMSDLNKHAQNYLAYKTFRENPLAEQLELLRSLQEPRLEKHLNASIRSITQLLERQGRKDSHFHQNKFRFESQLHQYLERSKAKKIEFVNLEKADHHLNCFYISQKLKHYCDVLGYKKFLSKDPKIELLPSFIEFVKSSPYLEEPAVQVYYSISQMYLYPEQEEHFHHFKEYLNQHLHCFGKSEQKSLYIFAMNYCIDLQVNNGKRHYFKELFALYRQVLEAELIFEEGFLDPTHYKNIIAIGLQVKEFDWVEGFIQSYTDSLPHEHQENAINYNMASLHFHKEEYIEVIEQLREVEYTNLSYALGSKLMLLRTYYELGEINALDSLIDSFRIYLRRNRLISKNIKRQYMNELRFTKKLISLPVYDKAAIRKLRQQIEDCKMLSARKWLLEKVAEVE